MSFALSFSAKPAACPKFGLVQSRFHTPQAQSNPFLQFDLEQAVKTSQLRHGISPELFYTAIHQYNDSFTLTSQARNRKQDNLHTPSLTDEYNAHRLIQEDLKNNYNANFEPYDLHVVNPWHAHDL